MDIGRFRYYTGWHHHANRRNYDTPADPWKLLPISPDDAVYYTDALRLNWGLGRVQGGDWDREEIRSRIRETALYRGLQQRFADGAPWEETALYRRAKERFESGETIRGYESLAEFRTTRCEYIDDLYRAIERDGYRPNAEATHESASDDNSFESAYANRLEPLVVIGRDGEIYWTEGYHRFAIASILGVDEIPVYVLCRHEQWQRTRDEIAEVPAVDRPPELEAYSDHPDLWDVRPDR